MQPMKMADNEIMLDDIMTKTKVSMTTYILVTIFGIGSWVAMNGIWVELPNLVNELPEGWRLPSYLTVICQLANIGPITYGILMKKYRGNQKKLLNVVVYVSLIIGLIACILLTIFWDVTAVISGKDTSVALLLLTFLLALVDCTSSVTFLPFMAILPGIYMSPLYIGETLSGFLPSLVALAQGIGNNGTNNATSAEYLHRISVINGLLFPQEVFFAFLALMMLICLLAFIGLNKLKVVRNQYVPNIDFDESPDYIREVEGRVADVGGRDADVPFQIDYHQRQFSWNHIALLVILVLCNTFQNGVLSSISSYAYAPYGSSTYHLAATLGSISSALSCFLFLWFPLKSKKVIYVGFISYTLFVVYLVLLATQSPNPWLKGTFSGKTIMVCVSVISGALVSFTKLSIASVMRDHGRRHLFWAGVSNQIGSFVGAVVMFPIVNFTKIFSD